MLSRVTFLSGSLERLHPVEHCVRLASLHRVQDVLLHLLRAVPMAAINYRFPFLFVNIVNFFSIHTSVLRPAPQNLLLHQGSSLKNVFETIFENAGISMV